jgi:hypothetical protein
MRGADRGANRPRSWATNAAARPESSLRPDRNSIVTPSGHGVDGGGPSAEQRGYPVDRQTPPRQDAATTTDPGKADVELVSCLELALSEVA